MNSTCLSVSARSNSLKYTSIVMKFLYATKVHIEVYENHNEVYCIYNSFAETYKKFVDY